VSSEPECRICNNTNGEENAEKTAIGYIPKPDSLDVSGLDVSPTVMKELFRLEKSEWENDLASLRKFLSQFGDNVPKGITEEANALEQRLARQA